MGFHFRIIPVSVALLTIVGSEAIGQNPAPASSSSYGHINTRFIPIDVLNRMKERPEGASDSTNVPGTPDTVWSALKRSIAKMDLPVSFEDRSAWQIGNAGGKIYRRLGKNPISTYLRCGEGVTGPNADSYMVHFSFLSVLSPAKDGTSAALYVLLTGTAIDVAGGRNDPVNCTSTGRLEAQLGKEVMKLAVLPQSK